MSSIGQYIYSLVVSAILVSLVLAIAPDKGAPSATLSLMTGIFLIIVAIAPVVKFRIGSMQNYTANIETDASKIISHAENYTKSEIARVIKEQTESYILDKAVSFGAEIKVEVMISNDGSCIPEKVQITGPISPLGKRRLSAVIKEDLGIPEELQIWTLM